MPTIPLQPNCKIVTIFQYPRLMVFYFRHCTHAAEWSRHWHRHKPHVAWEQRRAKISLLNLKSFAARALWLFRERTTLHSLMFCIMNWKISLTEDFASLCLHVLRKQFKSFVRIPSQQVIYQRVMQAFFWHNLSQEFTDLDNIMYAVPVTKMPYIKPEAFLKSYAGFPMEMVNLVILSRSVYLQETTTGTCLSYQ